MKNSVINFCGLLVLGICLVISSFIFSSSISNLSDQKFSVNASLNHAVGGSLVTSQSTYSNIQSEYLPIGEIASQLGYNDVDTFTQDLLSGKLGNMPYVDINGKIIFSRTAFDEWLFESARGKME